MLALFHGSLTEYQNRFGKFDAPISLTVGLPNEVLSGDAAERNVKSVKKWIRGVHCWKVEGEEYRVEVVDVKVASQITGGRVRLSARLGR